MSIGIYKIQNLLNGKLYIGQSVDIESRWRIHIVELRNNYHHNTCLQNAWNKYGEDNFLFEVIEECEPMVQFEREQYYLNILNPFDNRGYNIVRQISKDYMSDNYMIKECSKCKKGYQTFSHLSKYCDSCKEKMRKEEFLKYAEHQYFNGRGLHWGQYLEDAGFFD